MFMKKHRVRLADKKMKCNTLIQDFNQFQYYLVRMVDLLLMARRKNINVVASTDTLVIKKKYIFFKIPYV